MKKARCGVPQRACCVEAKPQRADQYSFLGSCMLRTRL
jgi:hypothetical protein